MNFHEIFVLNFPPFLRLGNLGTTSAFARQFASKAFNKLNVINCMNQYWEKKIYFGNFSIVLLCLKPCLKREKQDECASREWVSEMMNSLLKADLTFCLRKYFGMIVKLMISNVSRSRNLKTAENFASEIFVGLFRLPFREFVLLSALARSIFE